MGKKSKRKHLYDNVTFEWNVKPTFFDSSANQRCDSDEEVEEDEGTATKVRRLTKSERKQKEKEEETRLRQVEEELLLVEKNPKTADHFDRILLGQPNNSALWVKYMSFHLQATEFEKARAVAKRALATIDIREEQEKLNVWVALLNLENLYGTKESLKSCFEEAIRVNDDYKIHCKMLEILISSEKSKEADELVNRMCRKFKSCLDCWLLCAEALFKIGLTKKAKQFHERAILCLPKNEHITLLSRCALLNNKYGYSEEAQTLFEHILTAHPSRTDVWNCYVDMLIKSNSVDLARRVLERACCNKLPPKKMKCLFTKRLALEEKYGDKNSIECVKEEAKKYLQNVNTG